MNHPLRLIVRLLFVFLCITTVSSAQDSLKFPVPAGNDNQLFFLQRSQNTNTVVYELNIRNGSLDTASPVHIFWIDYAEKSQREELTGIQRKYAYGLAVKYIAKDHYELRLVAKKSHVLDLMMGADQKFHVYDQINGKRAILSRIYLQIHGGSPFSPNIQYILLDGLDPDTGAPVEEKSPGTTH